jgi:hypothetical protein
MSKSVASYGQKVSLGHTSGCSRYGSVLLESCLISQARIFPPHLAGAISSTLIKLLLSSPTRSLPRRCPLPSPTSRTSPSSPPLSTNWGVQHSPTITSDNIWQLCTGSRMRHLIESTTYRAMSDKEYYVNLISAMLC